MQFRKRRITKEHDRSILRKLKLSNKKDKETYKIKYEPIKKSLTKFRNKISIKQFPKIENIEFRRSIKKK